MRKLDFGMVSARTYVPVVDLSNREVTKVVGLGRLYSVSLEEAERAVNHIRTANPGREILAEFKIQL